MKGLVVGMLCALWFEPRSVLLPLPNQSWMVPALVRGQAIPRCGLVRVASGAIGHDWTMLLRSDDRSLPCCNFTGERLGFRVRLATTGCSYPPPPTGPFVAHRQIFGI